MIPPRLVERLVAIRLVPVVGRERVRAFRVRRFELHALRERRDGLVELAAAIVVARQLQERLRVLRPRLGHRKVPDDHRGILASLGLQELGNEQTRLPLEKFRLCGLDPAGSLHAMMLDTKRTFDELIERYAPSQDVARNILNNPFYRNLSSAMAGSHEYLALEKLYQLHLSGRYDLIVLDTPPTKHAMDFLEAPSRVRAFFDRRISQWFLKPYLTMGQIGIRLINRTAGTVLRLVERFERVGMKQRKVIATTHKKKKRVFAVSLKELSNVGTHASLLRRSNTTRNY